MFNNCAARQDRRAWSDRFVDSYRHLLAEHLGIKHWTIQIAPHEQDYYQATDLILPDGRTVACKTRTHRIWQRFGDEFALRHPSRMPYKTEYEKIKGGFGDLLLNTFCDEREEKIEHWQLIDLHVLRTAAVSLFFDCKLPNTIRGDGDVALISFKLDSIPEKYGQLVVATS